MFGLEILLALILKFWAILYGLVYGAVSSLPMLHRSLLARRLRIDWHEAEFLIVQSPDRDLHFTDLNIIAITANRAHLVFQQRDTLLMHGQTLRIAVDPDAEALVLKGEMLDLGRGRETRLYRRIERERGVLPP